jgi:hypothetical protein
MTAMLLASAYAGGVWFFVNVLRARQRQTVAEGFPPIVVFAGLLGGATFAYWDRFTHGHVAFWVARRAGIITPQSHTMQEGVAMMTGAVTLDQGAQKEAS